MHLSLLLPLFALLPQVVIADAPGTGGFDAAFKKRVADLAERDTGIQNLVGKSIGDATVARVVHLGRLDPRSLANRALGAGVNLSGVDSINTEHNFADFQSIKPTDSDSVEITITPRKEYVGKTLVVVFNIQAFGRYSYHKTKRLGDRNAKKYGSVSGIGSGVSNVPFHFEVETDETITLTLVPETDDRWWFGSIDVYELED